MGEDKAFEVGLEFNEKLVEKYPEVNASRKENNGNFCNVMYCEFEKDDPDYDSDELCCGH
mgnify:CR=1 FL=1